MSFGATTAAAGGVAGGDLCPGPVVDRAGAETARVAVDVTATTGRRGARVAALDLAPVDAFTAAR